MDIDEMKSTLDNYLDLINKQESILKAIRQVIERVEVEEQEKYNEIVALMMSV